MQDLVIHVLMHNENIKRTCVGQNPTRASSCNSGRRASRKVKEQELFENIFLHTKIQKKFFSSFFIESFVKIFNFSSCTFLYLNNSKVAKSGQNI